jgi:hypothetical protein
MNDYTKTAGFATLKRMIEKPSLVEAIYKGSVTEEQMKIRHSISVFETQKKDVDKLYQEFKDKAVTVRDIKRIINKVDDEDSQSSSRENSGAPPSKKQKEAGNLSEYLIYIYILIYIFYRKAC